MANPFLTAACLGAVLASCPALAFQSFADGPVSIVPRVKPAPAETEALLRVESSLVLIPAHVTTETGAPVTNLNKENFRLYEDRVEQRISDFAKDDSPISIGVLFDTSGSMQNKMRKSCEAAAAFFATSNPGDEFFLVKFNSKARLAVPFTTDSDKIYTEIARTKPSGQTSLLDAIHMALMEMKTARNYRKALVIFSDGGDNWSRRTVREVTNSLIESDVQVYAMGIFDPDYFVKHTLEERRGPQLLEDLAIQTGGRHYPVDDLDGLPAISARISRELRSEYLLGYYSTNTSHDGKYRQVNLHLTAPSGTSRLRTHHRQGYYAPSY